MTTKPHNSSRRLSGWKLQQLAIIRSMSLNTLPQDSRTVNSAAIAEKEALNTLKQTGAHTTSIQ